MTFESEARASARDSERETNVVYYKQKTIGNIWDVYCYYFDESYILRLTQNDDCVPRLCFDALVVCTVWRRTILKTPAAAADSSDNETRFSLSLNPPLADYR